MSEPARVDSNRNTRTSFQNLGQDIMNNENIKEGKIPTNTVQSKRRTIVGIRPENLSSSNNQRTSVQNPIVSNDRIDPIVTQGDLGNNSFDEDNKKINIKLQNEYKQDILTKQAIEEVKDHIEMFKLDINKYVQELRDEQEKIELGDIKAEIKILQEGIEKDLKSTRNQNDKDFQSIKEAFWLFREEVFTWIDNVVKENEEKISNLYIEIKNYEKEVNKRFLSIENKQEEYLTLLKTVLETTKDKQTREVVKQFLIDDKDIYEANKERYEAEFAAQREQERKELEDKEKEKLKIRLRAEEAELADEALEEEELRVLEAEAKMRENDLLRRKEAELIRKTEEDMKLHDDDIWAKRIATETSLAAQARMKEKENKQEEKEEKPEESVQLRTLKNFVQYHSSGEPRVRNFVKEASRNIFENIIKSLPLENKLIIDKNSKEMKDIVTLINQNLKNIFDDFTKKITSNQVHPGVQLYLKFIISSNHCIPYYFFSLFEISRLEIADGMVVNWTDEQKKWILAFYIIMKLLIKNIWIERNVLSDEDKGKISDVTRTNFKVIYSIIYNEVISIFRGICPIENNISDWEAFRASQGEGDMKLMSVLNDINKKLIFWAPDSDSNSVDYIGVDCYRPQDMLYYYSGVKETGFDLKGLIMTFWDKLLEFVNLADI